MRTKVVNLGGDGEEWSLHYTISYLPTDLETDGPDISRYVDFRAKDDGEAKAKILEILKRVLARVKSMRGRFLVTMAMPRVMEKGETVLDGNRIIRCKYMYSNKRLLRIRSSEVALVQGYGPEALKQLGR